MSKQVVTMSVTKLQWQTVPICKFTKHTKPEPQKHMLKSYQLSQEDLIPSQGRLNGSDSIHPNGLVKSISNNETDVWSCSIITEYHGFACIQQTFLARSTQVSGGAILQRHTESVGIWSISTLPNSQGHCWGRVICAVTVPSASRWICGNNCKHVYEHMSI